MEQGSADGFTFIGRWRGRRAWVLALAALLSAALALAPLWYLPAGRGSEDPAASAAEGGAGRGAAAGASAGRSAALQAPDLLKDLEISTS